MTKGKWLVALGVVLFGCGLVGFQMNPAAGPLPLLAGAVGGGLVSMLGILLEKGAKWAYRVGFILATICLMLGLAMAAHHVSLLLHGGKDVITPVLDGLIVIASGVTLWALKRNA